MADPILVSELAERGIPLTVCPLSNVRLRVVANIAEHPLKSMLEAGLHVTVNSDDPPFFGGYVTENLLACYDALDLSIADIVRIVRNGIEASFITTEERDSLLCRLDRYVEASRSVAPSAASSPASPPAGTNSHQQASER